MMHKAWSSIEEVPYYFWRSSVKFQGHTAQKIVDFDLDWAFSDWKIDDLNPIWVRLLGRSQLSNPSDLPCLSTITLFNTWWCIVYIFYIPRIMHMVYTLWCLVLFWYWWICPHPSCLLHCCWSNHITVSMHMGLPWCIEAALKNMIFKGLVQDCSNPIANALELLQSCTKPSMCKYTIWICKEWHVMK